MELVFGIICGLLILVFLVVVHELGHAIVARRNGVVVEEFGIGFPPRAWKRKLKNGVLLTLNWLPLGGFVKLQGEHDAASGKGDYGAATFWQKTRILLAGVMINWLVAAVLLTVLAWVGLPKILPNQFSVQGDTAVVRQPVELTLVVQGSPAQRAGLQVGDKVMSMNGVAISSADQLSQQAAAHKGATVELIYQRGGNERVAHVALLSDNKKQQGYLGVASGQREAIRATWSAPIVGVVTTGQFTWVTLKGIGELLVNAVTGAVLQFSSDETTRDTAKENLATASQSVAGPVGLLGTIFPAAERAGLVQLTFLTAIISLTLAVMNALPIPALDGGRWFTMMVYRLRHKPLTKEREESIQATGFLLLMTLIIVVTIADVRKFF